MAQVDLAVALERRFKHKETYEEIAKRFSVSRQAVQRKVSNFLQYLSPEKAELMKEYGTDLYDAAALTFLIESVDTVKLKKTSSRDLIWMSGVCYDKTLNKPSTSINITIAGQILQQAQADQISLKQAILQITGKDPDQLMQDITLPLPVVSNTILDGSIISDNPVLCSDNKDIPK